MLLASACSDQVDLEPVPDLGFPDAGQVDAGPSDDGGVDLADANSTTDANRPNADAGVDSGVTPTDGGSDASVEDSGASPYCWNQVAFFGDQGQLKQFGRKVLTVGDYAFASAYTNEGDRDWRLLRFSRGSDNTWSIDRDVSAGDVGSTGRTITALAADADRLWVGIAGADNGGEVIGLSFDLVPVVPRFQAPNGGAEFGTALAVNETTLFVGDAGRDVNKGAVDIFDIQSGVQYLETLTSTTTQVLGPRFASSLALNANRLLVGAPSRCQLLNCTDTGIVYEYKDDAGPWTYTASITAVAPNARLHGANIDWVGDEAWIAAPATYECVPQCYSRSTNPPGPGEGVCSPTLTPCTSIGMSFVEPPTSLELKASDLGTAEVFLQKFGGDLSTNGRWLAVGAETDSSCLRYNPLNGGCRSAGAVHLYERTGNGIVPVRYLKAKDVIDLAKFGASVALGDDYLVVGAPEHCGQPPGTNCTRSGGVYFFSSCR